MTAARHPDDPRRAGRLAFLHALRALRVSVAAGRPITLANCLRRCKRTMAALGVMDATVLARVASIYRRHQPFRGGPRLISIERKHNAA
jgi:hypothetical protein